MRKKQLIRKIKKEFICNRCGECCKAPGYVFVSGKELESISKFLKINSEKFKQDYCRDEEPYLTLKVKEDAACIFLTDKGCLIHEVKPKQCRQFPRQWREWDAYDYCEGIQALKE